MEVVAWVAITKFDCICVGGFVRDWIVRGKTYHPPGKKWMKNQILDPLVTPSDIDLELPFFKVFDIKKFQVQLKKYGIYIDKIRKIKGWRYQLTFDTNNEPFEIDLIEPMSVLCHDMCDFDVNNLYVKSGWTKEIGLRIETKGSANEEIREITLDNIVSRIKKPSGPELMLMRDRDSIVKQRIKKMQKRGWKVSPKKLSVIPSRENKNVERQLWNMEEVYKKYQKIFSGSNFRITKMYELNNKGLNYLFEGNRKQVRLENNGIDNMRYLFHGTKWDAEKGIDEHGFDNRYWKNGAFGDGAYFASTPAKSNGYTNENGNKEKLMYVAKVILGKQHVVNATTNVTHPPTGFHSLFAPAGMFRHDEYIVYRYGQALPKYKIVYKLN